MIKRTTNQTERSKQNTKRKRSMRRNMLDMGWNDLINKTTYKCELIGKNVENVNPRNTSKKCSVCGYINNELKLKNREWTCPDCGTQHDRDFNAATNIKKDFFDKNLVK